tara:strand:- start:351 stop:1004 length:654 start_codon:yes stop_codon:yes gene_type:complete
MKIADKLLHQDLNVHKESPFTVKKLKYQNAISRPNSFNTLANSLTRAAGNDTHIKEHLIKGFLNEIQEMNGNGNGGYDSNGNGTASTATTNGHSDELSTRASALFQEMDADLQSNPHTPRTLIHSRYDTSPSSHGSSVEFTGDEFEAEMAQLHHMPLPPYAFQQPLNYEPRRSSAGAGPSVSFPRAELDLLERMSIRNEENRTNPKAPARPSDYYDV